MRFILDNPAVILVIVAFALRAMRARSKAAAKREGPPPQDDERTRRVREEIQRRIAERRGPVVAPPAAEPAPEPAMVLGAEPPPPVSDLEEVLAEQRRLAEEVRVLDRAKPAPIPVPFRVPADPAPAAATGRRPGPFPELATPEAARRAVLLREVLGPPRGLSVDGCLWR